MSKVKVGIIGYKGRMGKKVTSVVLESDEAILSSCVSREAPQDNVAPKILKTPIDNYSGIKIASSILEVFRDSDVVIEFTNHKTMEECLIMAQKTRTPLVSGTTDHENYELMNRVIKSTPILWAANMSLGINMLSKLVEKVAKTLGEDYDIEVSEIHHSQKKDAPSGTSIMLGKSAAIGRNIDFESAKVIDRNAVRKKGDIGFAISRGGGVYGEHKVMFIGEDEYIELGHISLSRELFAKGAVKAALWLYNKNPGSYSMEDVLNEQ